MENPGVENIGTIRAKIVSLLIECPIDGHPDDCPLHEQRDLSFSEKFEWLTSLPDAELQKIYLTHCTCMKSKVY